MEQQRQSDKKRQPRKRTIVSEKLKVVLLNDDVTTYDFVIRMLMEVFFFDKDEAYQVAVETDTRGRAEVGVYPPDIAKSKVAAATSMARAENFPLQIITENA